MSKSMKAFFLAGVLSLVAVSAAYATDGPGDDNGRSHASAAPACGYECPVLAGDGGPGGPTDNTGRSSAALSQGGAEFRVAGGASGPGGDIRS